jgi:hypothetical protein
MLIAANSWNIIYIKIYLTQRTISNKKLVQSSAVLDSTMSNYKKKLLCTPNIEANVHQAWLDECAACGTQKEILLSSDSDTSGRKKCKLEYGGAGGRMVEFAFGKSLVFNFVLVCLAGIWFHLRLRSFHI